MGEQDGPPERQLKKNLVAILAQRPEVWRAYLVRVVFNDSQNVDVVLAVRTKSDPDDQLVQVIGKKFAKTFRRDVHLDTMFLSAEQEAEASAVCPPFYTVD